MYMSWSEPPDRRPPSGSGENPYLQGPPGGGPSENPYLQRPPSGPPASSEPPPPEPPGPRQPGNGGPPAGWNSADPDQPPPSWPPTTGNWQAEQGAPPATIQVPRQNGAGAEPASPGTRDWPPYSSGHGPGYDRPPAGSRTQRRGLLGGLLTLLAAIWAVGKYVLLFIGKFGILKTGLTLLISLGLYAVFFGFWGALGLVLMILLHELGHVVEIRRQGMKATAPLFIPFMGAAIFQRSHPTDALKQAQIGIAGPLAGTVAATAAFVLFGLTHNSLFLFWAWIGFYLNLFNLIPFGMLDGGWILAAASKWFQLLGLAALALAVLFFHLTFGPLLLILLIFGIPTMIARFRNDSLPYYQSVPTAGKVGMGLAWLVLVGYLGYASMQAYNLLTAQTALG